VLTFADLPSRYAVLAFLIIATLGCRATTPLTDLSELESPPRDKVGQTESEAREPTDSQQRESKQPEPAWHDELASDAWVRTVGKPTTKTARRWRHEGLEQLLALTDSPETTLTAALLDEDTVSTTNAAIGLARLGSARGLEALAAAVDNRDLPPRQRQAAAESLGEIKDPRTTEIIKQLLETLGRFDEQHAAAYDPNLHAELLRTLSDWQDEQVVDVFRVALAAPSPEVRLVALQAWTAHPDIPLPERVVALREDRSPRVRAATFSALAAHHVEKIERLLESGLRDDDLRVSLAAIAGLGKVATKTSADRLRRVLREDPEAFRAAAVEALAQMGDFEILFLAADDASTRVRLAAAQELHRFATPSGVELARRFLADSSTEVRRAVVEAVADWPLATAGNVLLEAMSLQTYRTRSNAAKQLAHRWPPAGEFVADESKSRRAEALGHLHARWHREFGMAAPAVSEHSDQVAAALKITDSKSAIQPEELQRVRIILQQLNELRITPTARDRLLVELSQRGPALPEILNRLTAEMGVVVSEDIYRRVLPKIDPLHEAIEGIATESVADRRAAAGQLIEFREELATSELATNRLFQQLIIRNDPLVWRSVLMAIEQSSTDSAIQIACAAAGHPSAEIRRRACEHLAHFPDPKHQALLTAALNDPDASVVRAAVAALGAGGQLDDRGPLRWLLRSDDWELQLAAAVALVKLSDADGPLALQRLAAEEDPAIRIAVAKAIGELGQVNQAAVLITMLDDRPVVRRAALAALMSVAGKDVATSARLDDNAPIDQVIAAWKRWWHTQQRTANAPRSGDQPSVSR